MTDYIAGVLRDAGIELANVVLVAALILLGVIVPLFAALYLLLKRTASHRGVNIKFQINRDLRPTDSIPPNTESFTVDGITQQMSSTPQDAVQNSGQDFDPRQFLKTVYKVLMVIVGTFLLVGTFFSYQAATPGNGLLLVSGILAILAVMAFLSIDKLDRQDIRAEEYRGILDKLLSKVHVSTSSATPEVYRMDSRMLARVQTMSQEGMSLDDICGTVNGNYASWSGPQQAAFQRVIKAVIEQGGGT